MEFDLVEVEHPDCGRMVPAVGLMEEDCVVPEEDALAEVAGVDGLMLLHQN